MKLSKKMLKELISEVVKERIDGAPQTYPSEEERIAQLRKQGLIPDVGEETETEYQTPRDPLEVIAKLNREIKKLEKMNLALINQVIDLGQTPVKTIVYTDPDADPEADTIVKK